MKPEDFYPVWDQTGSCTGCFFNSSVTLCVNRDYVKLHESLLDEHGLTWCYKPGTENYCIWKLKEGDENEN